MPTCRECRFFFQYMLPRDADEVASGECRRNPPRAEVDHDDGGILVLWPVVTEELWCGEWSPPLH
jgi:hypothetical protein